MRIRMNWTGEPEQSNLFIDWLKACGFKIPCVDKSPAGSGRKKYQIVADATVDQLTEPTVVVQRPVEVREIAANIPKNVQVVLLHQRPVLVVRTENDAMDVLSTLQGYQAMVYKRLEYMDVPFDLKPEAALRHLETERLGEDEYKRRYGED